MSYNTINIKVLIVIFSGHLALSLVSFLLLNASAVAAQDAGVATPGLRWLDIPVRFVLLQPLAHWVLAAVAVPWWTWPGLAALVALFALNSVVAVAVIAGVVAALTRLEQARLSR